MTPITCNTHEDKSSFAGTTVDSSTNVEVSTSSHDSSKPNVVGSLVKPHDRFKNAANSLS